MSVAVAIASQKLASGRLRDFGRVTSYSEVIRPPLSAGKNHLRSSPVVFPFYRTYDVLRQSSAACKALKVLINWLMCTHFGERRSSTWSTLRSSCVASEHYDFPYPTFCWRLQDNPWTGQLARVPTFLLSATSAAHSSSSWGNYGSCSRSLKFYGGILLCSVIFMSDKSTSNPETQNEATAHPENWPVKHSKPRF